MTRGVRGTIAPHGSPGRYTTGCRCDACRAAHTRDVKAYRIDLLEGRPRTVPRVGVRRRLQALAVIGWSTHDLAPLLGLSASGVSNLVTSPWPQVRACTARRVADVYDDLSTTDGTNARARAYARRAGWLGPEWWDDATIDDPDAAPLRPVGIDAVLVARVLAGTPQDTTTAEREVIVPRLVARNLSDQDIARLVRVTPETVLRTRRRLGIESRWVA